MKKTSKINKILDSRIIWAAVALMASLAIWIYVTGQTSDEVTQTFNNVQVQVVGADTLRNARNLVVTDLDTTSVTLELVGPRRVVASLSSASITAQIDVSKLTQASSTSLQYYISYPDGTDKSNIREVKKTPETISFLVSDLISKTVQVRGSFDGYPADGFTAETPVFEPSTITVTGPSRYLNNVEYAWVSFGEEGITSTYQSETGYVLMDADGEECVTTGFTYSTDTVIATLPLLELKELPVTVELLHGAGTNADNVRVHVEPSSISLAGDTTILSTMDKIVLDTIDLTKFTSTYTEAYPIALDENLKNLTGVNEATVTIEIIGLETKVFKVNNLNCINVTEGYAANITSESIEVTLRGLASDLELVKSTNIRMVADLKDYNESTGSYMAVAKVYVDGFTGVGALGENTISIEIRPA